MRRAISLGRASNLPNAVTAHVRYAGFPTLPGGPQARTPFQVSRYRVVRV